MKQLILPMLISVVLISLCFVFFEDLEIYFEELLRQLQNNARHYTLISFLVLSSDIVLPIPSSIVMYLNGWILGIFQGFLLSILASMLSTTIGYFLGKLTAMGLKQSANNKTQQIIQKYGGMAIIMTRGIPILSESISLTLGYNRMNFKVYTLLNFIGFLPICLIYAYFGSLGQQSDLFLIAFGASLLIALLMWLLGRKLVAQLFDTV